ncbi:MAG TPA: transposase [Virgibacillus sp.]|nr:transposase [Virgibacillus sp.]HLR69588.1 transposase [Virgibacillus sp.]
MATLPETTLDYNRKIKLTNDGGDLSSDTGSFLFREFEEKIGFFATLMKHLNINHTRQYYVHSNEQLLRQKFFQMIAPYAAGAAAYSKSADGITT